MTSKACPLRHSHLLPEPVPTPGPASTPSAERLPSNAVQPTSALAQPTTDRAVEARVS
ncbi:hypothetical protein LZ32DRAFT_611420 [Colletotrichum eremochloae]|nr:hypothetical protein LZ32DRAFT_611420 [Colletotrichum eremochloae]